jgi:hypothetical protein
LTLVYITCVYDLMVISEICDAHVIQEALQNKVNLNSFIKIMCELLLLFALLYNHFTTDLPVWEKVHWFT